LISGSNGLRKEDSVVDAIVETSNVDFGGKSSNGYSVVENVHVSFCIECNGPESLLFRLTVMGGLEARYYSIIL